MEDIKVTEKPHTVTLPKEKIKDGGDVVINIFNNTAEASPQNTCAVAQSPPYRNSTSLNKDNYFCWLIAALLIFAIGSNEPVSSYLNSDFLLSQLTKLEINSVFFDFLDNKEGDEREENEEKQEEKGGDNITEKAKQNTTRSAPPSSRKNPSVAATEFGTLTPKFSQKFRRHTDPAEFLTKTKTIANDLHIPPEYLLAVMSFESARTFLPDFENSVSGAVGLIQFMPKTTAPNLGTSGAKLKKMTSLKQLDYVYKYLSPFKSAFKKDSSLGNVYSAVLWPRAVGKSSNTVIFRRGTIQYRQNSGLDKNNNGVVTKKEIEAHVRGHLPPKGFLDKY